MRTSIATVSIIGELPENWRDRQGGLETEEYPRQEKELVGFFNSSGLARIRARPKHSEPSRTWTRRCCLLGRAGC
ncbi:hypothetical protein EMEDMD4_980044 [Sinorhizobium medicae]|uniref:Uncharacterized protein n=1 Tax=Sinorhizobium medicae TaxID=110321 RepID=A0A508XCL1_9HYPH|nr:hypothetical protein EMEDMD4_980044 [Sinorhizobium medicae]